jgi:hypothetical protein
MEQSSCKVISHSTDYYNFRSLYSMKFQYCLQKNPSLLPILSQLNLVHTLIFTSVSQVLGLYIGIECEKCCPWMLRNLEAHSLHI